MSASEKLPFDRAEYEARIAATRDRMDEVGIDVLVVSDQSNMYYLTGYGGLSDYVAQCVVLTPDGDPRVILRAQDVPCARHTVFMDYELIHEVPESLIGVADRSGWDHIGDLLRSWGYGASRIGVEYRSVEAYVRLPAALPDARFVNATHLVTWIRGVKSEAELGYMRQAARIAEHTMQVALDTIAMGVRECDVAAAIMAAQASGLPEFGGDQVAGAAFMPSGERTDSPHLAWTDERYEPDTPVNIELGGSRMRYCIGLSRSMYIGQPPARLRALHEATLEGMVAVLEAARPGETCEALEAIFRATTSRHGFVKDSRIGYGIGVDWSERNVSLQPGDRTVLKPSMTFHLMLGMWQPGWGYVLSECFRITESGAESFARFPRDLFVKN